MSYLLDTNVVSEWVKPRPNPGLVGFIQSVDEDEVFISVVTVIELRHGIERMASGARRAALESWLVEDLPLRFDGRMLTVDVAIADRCGRVLAQGRQRGRPLGPMDALMAATAQVHALTLVSRNVADFTATGLSVLNPWTPQ